MAASSSSDVESIMSDARNPASPPSSPPPDASPEADGVDDALQKHEDQARQDNIKAEEQRRKASDKKRKKKKKAETKAEREAKARELDELLMKSAAFSDILTKKTQMAQQPKCLVGGTMREYQLEGLTWMYEICAQGMSGILADEMGLGKTVQTISLIALLREQENYLGPHLIVAPLSTLSNWMDEFHKWTPSIPVIMYHGNQRERESIFKSRMMNNLEQGRPNTKFPVVCTSYEMVLRDQHNLSRINWEFIIIDEGHRMKNAESKLFQQLRQFSSATRLLITGTPLQNNLKELWSLLHFLLPNIFTDWDAFESWFDFSDLENEESTETFIGDRKNQDLVKKIHLILQPLLLRRIKQDVAAYLPKKREYVLFAPMTKEQTDLYNAFTDGDTDTRAYLEQIAVEKMTSYLAPPSKPRTAAKKQTSLPLRQSPSSKKTADRLAPSGPNAFALMMGKCGPGRPPQKTTTAEPPARAETAESKLLKRKAAPTSPVPDPKSAKSSRASTPASSRGRGRKTRSYKDANTDEEDALSDDAFEARLADELAADEVKHETQGDARSPEEMKLAQSLELAKKQIAQKKLGNPLAQLRLVCNSPHNFYNPWAANPNIPVDESLITASGKMLLLDRLLPKLFREGHKVLIFSQFTTQLDILEDYCRELRGWKVCRIDGSVQQDSRRQQIHDFNTDPEHRLFLLSTRAGGQGINLASADTVVLFDSDFNPQQDLQAQDRCHRIGQTRPVIVYRLATRATVEESLLMSADAKRRLEKLVIRKGGFKSMHQKMNNTSAAANAEQDLDPDTLRRLLLRDGLVYHTSGGDDVLAEADLRALCDRSDDAFDRAASGLGDADRYRVVETGADAIRLTRKD
ncbi:type III restriction enzyme, res subunit [Hirsutella rhossiliensis]|uniref:Type III restriction enzyme, res subunit domain-containing protein n=1 Tax=Hirsutella rhossiliensis TaxID=111463 RepID=A0A9P8MXP1_9HYPO|nr:type III restriction enzyme, res subunit domain-containing protein [Hirsutella rhossiliensis]KAH0961062.1 type III restriction enzyme, res subunit domain-containing protein [Hirsutella rhossiliensis]